MSSENSPKPNLRYFIYEVVHNCNLNCNYCDHCAPLAKKEQVLLETFERDITQMAKVFNKIQVIGIMGGEPLLHPRLNDILKVTRRILKSTDIRIYTNGLLLPKKDDDFWETIRETKTKLLVTQYVKKYDYKILENLAKKNNADFSFFDDTDVKPKVFCKQKYNLDGNEDIEESYKNCFHARNFNQLENGILYKCTIIPASRHLNEYFGTNLQITERDGINIYKNPTFEQLKNYFDNPLPFCRYCNVKGRENDKPWGFSKRKIEEWT